MTVLLWKYLTFESYKSELNEHIITKWRNWLCSVQYTLTLIEKKRFWAKLWFLLKVCCPEQWLMPNLSYPWIIRTICDAELRGDLHKNNVRAIFVTLCAPKSHFYFIAINWFSDYNLYHIFYISTVCHAFHRCKNFRLCWNLQNLK